MPHTETKSNKITVSHSELASYARCRLQHHYSYEERLRKVITPKSLALGRLVHLGLAWYYTEGRDAEGALSYYNMTAELDRARLDDATGLMTEDDWAEVDHTQTLGRAMLRGYFTHQAPTDSWEVLEVERDIVVPIPIPGGERVSNRYEYKARLDMIISDQAGIAVVDHKTATTRISDSDYLRNDQMLRYLWAVQVWTGLPVRRVIINGLKKPALKLGRVKGYWVGGDFYSRKSDANKAARIAGVDVQPEDREETIEELRARMLLDVTSRPDHYFQRLFLEYSQADINRAGETVYWLARERYTKHAVYRSPGIHCNWCEFAELCLNDNENTRLYYEERSKK